MNTEKVIEVDTLSWKYSGSSDYVLKNISFHVNRGECIGILGPTGAGKTTLLYCLNGLIPHNFPGELHGRVMVESTDTRTKKVPELSKIVGMIFEDPEAQFVGLTVEEDIVFGLENLCLPSGEIGGRLEWALRAVKMEGFERRNAHTLSGGEKQRVAIASILALRPQILLLDEPTAELDPVGKHEVFEVLNYLKQELGMTLIIVEHEVEELVKVADRLMLLSRGEILSSATPRELFRDVRPLEAEGIRPLEVAWLANHLRDTALFGNEVPLTEDECTELLLKRLKG